MRSMLLLALLFSFFSAAVPQPKGSVKECARQVQLHLEQDPDAIRRALFFHTELIQSFTPRLSPLQFWVLNILKEREGEPVLFAVVGINFQYRQFSVSNDILESALQRMERGGRLVDSERRAGFDKPWYTATVLGDWEHQQCHLFYQRLYETAETIRRESKSRSVKRLVDAMTRPRSIIPKLGHSQAILLAHLSSNEWKTATQLWEETGEFSTPTDKSNLYGTMKDLRRVGFVAQADIQVGETWAGRPKYQTAYRMTPEGENALARAFFFYVKIGDGKK